MRSDSERTPPRQAERSGRANAQPELALLVDVIEVCSTNEDLTLTLQLILERVCETNGWFIGVAHLGKGTQRTSLRLAAQHVATGYDRLLPLASAGVNHAFSQNGDISQIVNEGKADWIMLELETEDDAKERVQVATLPILADGSTVGLFQFVASNDLPISPEMRDAIEAVATLAGRTISHKQLKAAAGRAASNERTRLGRSLHDTVCQQLAGLALSADKLKRCVSEHSATLAEDAASLAQGIRDAQQDLRAALADMLPIGLDHGHIAHALKRLADITQTRYTLDCNISCDEDIVINDDHVATMLYFIASEAVSNAARHSAASKIHIALTQSSQSVQLLVQDNGRGITDKGHIHKGYGLSAMRHRALSIHGIFSITSTADKGTTVRCEVPYHALNDNS